MSNEPLNLRTLRLEHQVRKLRWRVRKILLILGYAAVACFKTLLG